MFDDPKWPLILTKNNRLLVLNVIHQHTKYVTTVQASLLKISYLQGFQFEPLTLKNLWPPPKTYIPNMRIVLASLLEISCLQGFHNFTPVDPTWLLTSSKNNRFLAHNVVHLHTPWHISEEEVEGAHIVIVTELNTRVLNMTTILVKTVRTLCHTIRELQFRG